MFSKITMVFVGLCIATALSSCSKKQNLKSEDTNTADFSSVGGKQRDSDSGSALGLETVYFRYDSAELDSSSKTVLKRNADILKRNSNVYIQIEGHCDERGGIQYNLALGERRARAIQQYLWGQGVPKSRTTVISFGKERPISFGDTEEAHSKNRRGNFIITSEE